MDQIRSILTNYLSSGSIKRTARELKISKNTVRTYLRRASAHGTLSELLKLSDEALGLIFYSQGSQSSQHRQSVFESQLPYWLSELRRVGVTRWLLWESYRRDYPDGYGYSYFCEGLRQAAARQNLSLALSHVAGETMMVDFAGKKLAWMDRSIGQLRYAEVLVAVFPHSQYTFAICLPSQQLRDFVKGLNAALLFFGGLPQVILSDNLKSYVSRADRYEPQFTELCEQLGAYYHVDLSATRVGKPKDKASVERAVGIVYNRIYAPLRDQVFYSLEELNTAVRGQIKWHNAQPFQKKAGCRQSVFDTYELPAMRKLPGELFEIKKITRAKVQRNYHVFLGEEKNYYSVPFRYVGKQAEVIYTSEVVEIYIDNQRVVTHSRLPQHKQYAYQTLQDHMPRSHQEWRKAESQDAASLLGQADKIGPATRWAIEHLIRNKIYPKQSYDSCRAVLRLAKSYSPERLESAAQRCQKVQAVSLQKLKRILAKNLDQIPEQPPSAHIPQHENIRGPGAYQ